MGARGVGHIADLCAIAPPEIGVVLNVGSAHVGEFGSAEVIAQAKGELVEALPADGVAVLNADDPLVRSMASRTSARVLTFGTSGDVALGPVTLDELGQPHFTLSHEGTIVDVHVPQIGEHHAINAAAATAAAIAAGVGLPQIAERLGTATAVSPMRMEHHVRDDGLVVVNDAYNANPESMAAALRAVAALGKGRPIAVLGEMLELGDASHEAHLMIGRLAAELGYVRVVAVGPGAAAIAEGAGKIGETTDDVDAAVELLSASLRADDIVLVKASRGGRLERVAHALLGH
jgi:UDP-N-acetylmuramoyl-tripeptide--D-alanyl-D-alanine ligase